MTIRSMPTNNNFRDGWERTFAKKEEPCECRSGKVDVCPCSRCVDMRARDARLRDTIPETHLDDPEDSE